MVNVYDVGDAAPLRLRLDHADETTVATVSVRSPTGAEAELAASPNADRDEWTTALQLPEPGVWLTTWTVTGTGAGVETHQVIVRGGGRWRSYATTADLAGWPGVTTVPLDAGVLLARATRLVDRFMIGARWEAAEGTENLPADPDVAGAYRDATCAQVAAWLEQGAGDFGEPEEGSDEDEAAGLLDWARSVGASSVSLGPVSVGFGKSSSSSSSGVAGGAGGTGDRPAWSTVAEQTRDIMLGAGLWPPRPRLAR